MPRKNKSTPNPAASAQSGAAEADDDDPGVDVFAGDEELCELVLVRDVALGHGTRKRGTVLGVTPMIGDGFDPDHVQPADGIGEDEIELAVANSHHLQVVPLDAPIDNNNDDE